MTTAIQNNTSAAVTTTANLLFIQVDKIQRFMCTESFFSAIYLSATLYASQFICSKFKSNCYLKKIKRDLSVQSFRTGTYRFIRFNPNIFRQIFILINSIIIIFNFREIIEITPPTNNEYRA